MRKSRDFVKTKLEEDHHRPLRSGWNHLDGGRYHSPPRHRWKLKVMAAMYVCFAAAGILWQRFVSPQYDWLLIVVFVAIMIAFALIVRGQQLEMRRRLISKPLVKVNDSREKLKILIVESEPATLQSMTEILAKLEVDVLGVNDSREALSLIKQIRFDAIFLDLLMPVLDGYTLAAIIRESLCNRSTPIIFNAESSVEPFMQQAFSVASSFFLQKPVDQYKIRLLLNAAKGIILDNRRCMRRVNLRVDVLCNAAGSTQTAVSCDVSERGIRIDGVRVLKPGDQSVLSFRLPTQSKPITATGQVVRIDDSGEVRIHFVGIEQIDRKRIGTFINSQEHAESA